ncbi:MAG TPA: nuclear transport factor 2 family protein [Longimicrobium sp.]
MRILLILVAAALVAAPQTARAQAPADSAAIRQTALDYALGWYDGDGPRMQRALHPELAKRRVSTDDAGRSRIVQMSAMTLVGQAANGGGRDTPAAERRADVRILDLFQNVASVRVDMSGWIDYMHIAKWNGRWVIVNVLWEDRRDAAR